MALRTPPRLHATQRVFPREAFLRTFYGFLSPFERRDRYVEDVTKHLTPRQEYCIGARNISGTHSENMRTLVEQHVERRQLGTSRG